MAWGAGTSWTRLYQFYAQNPVSITLTVGSEGRKSWLKCKEHLCKTVIQFFRPLPSAIAVGCFGFALFFYSPLRFRPSLK
jgi:hypothetical protein